MLDNYFTTEYWRIFKMIDFKEELLAPCGLYCGVCRIYLAHKDNDLEFKKEIVKLYIVVKLIIMLDLMEKNSAN